MRRLLTLSGVLGLMALCAAVVPIGSADAAMQAGYSPDTIGSQLSKGVTKSTTVEAGRPSVGGSEVKALAPERGGVVKAGAPGDRSSLDTWARHRGGLAGSGGIDTLNARPHPYPS